MTDSERLSATGTAISSDRLAAARRALDELMTTAAGVDLFGPEPDTEPANALAPVITVPATRMPPAGAPAPVAEQTAATGSAVAATTPSVVSRVADTPVYFGWRDDGDDPAWVLSTAVERGITDLVVVACWTKQEFAAAGWDTGTWQGAGDAVRVTRLSDGAEVRVWTHLEPEHYATGLRQFAERTGRPVRPTVPATTLRLLNLIGSEAKGQHPRWQGTPVELREALLNERTGTPVEWSSPDLAPGAELFGWDRNKAYLSAMTAARVAPLWQGEDFTVYAGADVPSDLKGLAGMVRIIPPTWPWPHLPSPTAGDGPVWVSADVVKLYDELHIDVQTLAAWLAPQHRCAAIDTYAAQLKTWLTDWDGDPAATIAKGLYQSLWGALCASGRAGKKGSTVHRPDWGWAIHDIAWCNLLRTVYKIWHESNRAPVKIATDAIYYVDPEPPAGLRIGTGFGEWKQS